MSHHQSVVSGVDHHANRLSSIPNNQCQISAVFPALTPYELRSRVAPCSGKCQRHLEILCRWYRCTKRGFRRRQCPQHCHRNQRKVQGPCGWLFPFSFLCLYNTLIRLNILKSYKILRSIQNWEKWSKYSCSAPLKTPGMVNLLN